MPRFPFLRLLQKAFASLRPESSKPTPSDPSRRRFIKNATLAGLSTLLIPSLTGCRRDSNGLRKDIKIVVVGAGVAGLHAAYVFKKEGFRADIYEASDRTGGRIYSDPNVYGGGLVTELGGEFVDSGHTDMLNLATEFGLQLIDTEAASEQSLQKDTFYFDGRLVTEADVVAELSMYAGAIQADIDTLPEEWTYHNASQLETLDSISLKAYLDDLGVTGWFRDLMDVAFVTEFGLECSEQSCLNMLGLISTDVSTGEFKPFGDSDERYKILGGNQQIPKRMAEDLADQIHTGHKLVKIQKARRHYVLTFDDGQGFRQVDADYIVLAIPFTILRGISFEDISFPQAKQWAIDELTYGNNAKLFLGFNDRIWRLQGYAGYTYSNAGVQLGWDNSQLQNDNVGAGGFTVFVGGQAGDDLNVSTPEYQADRYLPILNSIYPSIQQAYTNVVKRFHWPTYPFSKGSYPCYKVGQYARFAGAEAEPVEEIYFAGDHCSLEFQGYMNGAAQSGRIAAEKILEQINA